MDSQSSSKKTTATLNKSIAALVKQSVSGKKELNYAVQHISGEGPRHKLLQNEWLFDELLQLVKSVEKKSGKKFTIRNGSPLVWAHKKESIHFPVPLPFKKDAVAVQQFTEGPEHETLMYSIALQVLHWAAATVKEIK